MLAVRERSESEQRAELWNILKSAGVILDDPSWHYVGASGKHLEVFFNMEALFDPGNEEWLATVARMLADAIAASGLAPQWLAGPAEGGNLLTRLLAPLLSERLGYVINVAVTEKTAPKGKEFRFQEPAPDLRGEIVLVIDDVMTSGLSCTNTVRICHEAGARIAGIFVVVDREDRTATGLGVPYYGFLLPVQAKSYDVPKLGRRACDLCCAGVQIHPKIGHGAQEIDLLGQPYVLEHGN